MTVDKIFVCHGRKYLLSAISVPVFFRKTARICMTQREYRWAVSIIPDGKENICEYHGAPREVSSQIKAYI